MRKRLPILAVTGTKGKTTVVRVLDELLRTKFDQVLRVDTTGAYINGEQKIDLEASLNFTGLVPTVAPGKYLPYLYRGTQEVDGSAAVLEAALGSSARPGMGYKNHKVGIFTNVLEDHIGSSSRIQSRQDIANAKEFIFTGIDLDGWAVINADDDLVMQKVAKVPEKNLVHKVYCSLNPDLVVEDGVLCTIRDGQVLLCTANMTLEICRVSDVSWTFGGVYRPSLYNLMFVCAGYYGFFDGQIDVDELATQLRNIHMDEEGGRLTKFVTPENITILADYAHEKYSLKYLAELAHSIAGAGNVIGVLRLAYDRSDELIEDTAVYIASAYDRYVIYDKIDGKLKQPVVTDSRKKFQQVVGKISKTLTEKLVEHGAQSVERVVSEDDALKYAASIASSGDVVVHIVNDDIAGSIGYIKQAFPGAELRR